MMNSESQASIATAEDCKELAAFIQRENNSETVTENYLRWWFYEAGDGYGTICFEGDREITVMACTRNFRMIIEGRQELIAMPQKVLTAAATRKKGLFSRLYYATEQN